MRQNHLEAFLFSHCHVSLQPHGLQHTRLPCPSLSPRVCSDSCPLSWWCHPTFWSSVIRFSSCPQSFPAWGSFPMSQLFTSVATVLELQLQHQSFQWILISFRIDWFDLLAVQGTLKSLLQYHSSKASILWCLTFFMVQISHPYMTIGKTIALTLGLWLMWRSSSWSESVFGIKFKLRSIFNCSISGSGLGMAEKEGQEAPYLTLVR